MECATDYLAPDYLNADKLGPDPRILTITRWIKREFEENRRIKTKYVLFFEEFDLALPLNETNLKSTINLHGKYCDPWIGKRIELYTTLVDFKGDKVPAIRIRAPQTTAQLPARSGDMLDDEIPF